MGLFYGIITLWGAKRHPEARRRPTVRKRIGIRRAVFGVWASRAEIRRLRIARVDRLRVAAIEWAAECDEAWRGW
jgi:hypothetical protein